MSTSTSPLTLAKLPSLSLPGVNGTESTAAAELAQFNPEDILGGSGFTDSSTGSISTGGSTSIGGVSIPGVGLTTGGSGTSGSSGLPSTTTGSTSGSCTSFLSIFTNPLGCALRLLFLILGIVCVIGAIYLFKPTSEIVAAPLRAAKEGIKGAAEGAALA